MKSVKNRIMVLCGFAHKKRIKETHSNTTSLLWMVLISIHAFVAMRLEFIFSLNAVGLC